MILYDIYSNLLCKSRSIPFKQIYTSSLHLEPVTMTPIGTYRKDEAEEEGWKAPDCLGLVSKKI